MESECFGGFISIGQRNEARMRRAVKREWPYIWEYCHLCKSHYRVDYYLQHECVENIDVIGQAERLEKLVEDRRTS